MGGGFKVEYQKEKFGVGVNLFKAQDLKNTMPLTAVKYFNGLLDTIDKLKTTGKLFAYSQNNFLTSNYGADVRTINYKKMTIVYKVIGKNVVVLRIMAGSLIK